MWDKGIQCKNMKRGHIYRGLFYNKDRNNIATLFQTSTILLQQFGFFSFFGRGSSVYFWRPVGGTSATISLYKLFLLQIIA